MGLQLSVSHPWSKHRQLYSHPQDASRQRSGYAHAWQTVRFPPGSPHFETYMAIPTNARILVHACLACLGLFSSLTLVLLGLIIAGPSTSLQSS